MSTENEPPLPAAARPSSRREDSREYDQTGLNPPGEKGFRLWALLGFLAGVIVFIAIAAYALDRILL